MKSTRKWIYEIQRIIEVIIAVVTIAWTDAKHEAVIRSAVGTRVNSPHEVPQVLIYVIGQPDLFSEKTVSICRRGFDRLTKGRKIELVVKIKDRR